MPSRSSAPKPLAHPPAVEVIFGLQCVTPDDLDQEAVGKALTASLPSGFTVERQVDHVNIAVKGDGKGQVEHTQSQAWSGVKVVNTDGTVAGHFMRFGAFVNFTQYRGFEDGIGVVRTLWEAYCKAFTPQQVMRLSIRYINVLKLPFDTNDKVQLDRYFKVLLTFPEELSTDMTHFHHQIVIRDPKTGMPARVMISSMKEEGDQLHVAFDNEGYREGQWVPDDNRIWQEFEAVRDWTYHIFKTTLTPECLEQTGS